MDRLFIGFSVDKLQQLEGRIEECLDRLSPEQIWWRPSEENNSVANLVLHLSGNVRQWIITSVGDRPSPRDRDAEFSARGNAGVSELQALLHETVNEAVSIIEGLTADRLNQRVQIQGFDVSVLEAVYHVVEHFALHAGQIMYITKALRKEDLGFYRHLQGGAAHNDKTP
jgi:uncharacterized damage-inducible protein DinB